MKRIIPGTWQEPSRFLSETSQKFKEVELELYFHAQASILSKNWNSTFEILGYSIDKAIMGFDLVKRSTFREVVF